MEYKDFYDIAEYANVNWNKCKFTPKEVACGAYDYLVDFEKSCKIKKPVGCIIGLLDNLEEDITDNQAWEWIRRINVSIERRSNG